MGDITKYNKNNKTWRYRLISSLGETLLKRNPVGWDSKQLSLVRNETYLAVFRSFSASVDFILDGGYDELKELEETEGILAECELKVDKRNTTTLEDIEVFSAQLDFSEFTESNANKAGISVPLVDSTFQERLKNYESTPIPVDRPSDLKDNAIDPIEYQDIELLGREFGGVGNGIATETSYTFQGPRGFMGITWQNVNLLPNFQDTVKATTYTISEALVTNCFYYTDLVSAELKGAMNIKLDSNANTNNSIILALGTFKDDGTLDSYVEIFNISFQGFLDRQVGFAENLTAKQGLFLIMSTPSSGVVPTITVLPDFDLKIEYISRFEPTPCKVVLPFEAFDYLAASITGEENSFRSNYFGRTDLGYSEDGAGAYIALTNGLLIRQFPTGYQQLEGEDRKAQLSFTFKELFETYYKVKDVAIEVINEDGKYIIVAEKRADLFTYDEVLTISPEEMEQFSFERVRDESQYYSEIEVGYQTNPDDLFGGLEEYISKEKYSTILDRVQNTFDLVAPYSAATVPIEKQRRRPFAATSTEELTGDNQIYLIELINDNGTLKQRTTEGFSEINGLEGLDTYLNLGLTPKQNLFEHGSELSAGLLRYPTSKVLYGTSDKVTDLSFIRDTTEGLIVENGTEVANRFADPIFSGYVVNFSAPLGLERFIDLRNNTKKIIRYTNPITKQFNFGWIKDVSTEPVERTTNWQLYEAYPADINDIGVLATDLDEAIITDKDELIQVT